MGVELMKQPGQYGVQGIDIDRLKVDHELTAGRAVELAQELADDANMDIEAYNDPNFGLQIEGRFVRKAIDFRQNDMFVIEHPGGPNDYHKVVSDHNYHPTGIKVAPVNAEPGTPKYERAPDYEQVGSYGNLWYDWLRGRVVQVERVEKYVRADTGQEVDV